MLDFLECCFRCGLASARIQVYDDVVNNDGELARVAEAWYSVALNLRVAAKPMLGGIVAVRSP